MEWQVNAIYATVFLLSFSALGTMALLCAQILDLLCRQKSTSDLKAPLIRIEEGSGNICFDQESKGWPGNVKEMMKNFAGVVFSIPRISFTFSDPLSDEEDDHYASRQQAYQDSQRWLKDEDVMMLRLADVAIAISLSDPLLDDNPLIGISPGFTALTGYSFEECIGKNCRFLIKGVPEEEIFESERSKAREFGEACQHAASMEHACVRDPEDCMCMQRNSRKDGTLFWNLFLMRFARIRGKAYVLAIQHELDSMGDEMNQALWQTSIHLKASLWFVLDRLSDDHSVPYPTFGQIGQGFPWSSLDNVYGLENYGQSPGTWRHTYFVPKVKKVKRSAATIENCNPGELEIRLQQEERKRDNDSSDLRIDLEAQCSNSNEVGNISAGSSCTGLNAHFASILPATSVSVH